MVNKKKAEYEIFSIWWFVVLAIIALVVAVVVNMYVSAEVDVRGYESGIMYNQIANCFIQNGFLKQEVLDNNFDIYSFCALSNKSIVGSNLFFTLVLKNESGSILKKIQSEGTSYFDDCLVSNMGEKGASFPKCVYRNESVYYFVNGERKYYTMELMTASNHFGVNLNLMKKQAGKC